MPKQVVSNRGIMVRNYFIFISGAETLCVLVDSKLIRPTSMNGALDAQ